MKRIIAVLVVLLVAAVVVFAAPKVKVVKPGQIIVDGIVSVLISNGWEDKSEVKKVIYCYITGSIEVITKEATWQLSPSVTYNGILLYKTELISEKTEVLYKAEKKKKKKGK